MKLRILNALLLGTIISLSGCSAFQKPTVDSRVSSSLKTYEFNDVASAYYPRPTFVTVESKEGKQYLHIDTSQYGKMGYDPMKQTHVFFSKEHVSEYVAYIDKYLEWEELASSRKDQIDKEIGRVGTLNGVLVFDFYSGNSANHYLVVSTTAESMTFGTRLWSAYFPVNEAKTLKSLLLKFEAGTFKAVDEDIYN